MARLSIGTEPPTVMTAGDRLATDRPRQRVPRHSRGDAVTDPLANPFTDDFESYHGNIDAPGLPNDLYAEVAQLDDDEHAYTIANPGGKPPASKPDSTPHQRRRATAPTTATYPARLDARNADGHRSTPATEAHSHGHALRQSVTA